MKTIRILLSSPGDVVEERRMARLVIEQLQRQFQSRARLVPVLWEDLPLGADTSFQEGIDLVLTEKHRIDIAVFLLWSRLGSPLGRPPRRDGTPYRSGTEREFDMMLEARRQSGGKSPHLIAYVRDDEGGFRQALTHAPSDQWMDIFQQYQLVREFIREQFQDEKGRNLRAYHLYDRPLTFASRLKVHLRALIEDILGQAWDSPPIWDQPPYRGLQVFDVEHAPIFFGREQEVCDVELLLRRRAEAGRAFVVIVGPSGSGKSSLARAGVAASLLHANLDASVKEWRLALLQPGSLSGDLLGALVAALAEPRALRELGEGDPASMARLRESLHEAPRVALSLMLPDALRRAGENARGEVRVLLLVDQMEELWTNEHLRPEQRDAFLDVLDLLATEGRIWVLATMRADFYPVAMQNERFARLKRDIRENARGDGVFELLPPDPSSIHRLIREPALRAGLTFEKNETASVTLDDVILKDAIGHPDALPLIEFALQQLFERRTPAGLLTFSAYEQIGGMEKALGLEAESAFTALPTAVQSAFAKTFRALVSVSADAQAQIIRRPASLAALTDTPAARELTEAFIARRFFTSDREQDVPVVRIAHEALLRRWQRLALWISSNQEHLLRLARIEQAHARWQAADRHTSLLLPPGLPLEEARTLQAEAPDLLPAGSAEYVRLSAAHEADERRARTRNRRIWYGSLVALTVAALGAAGWALKNQREAAARGRVVFEQSAAQRRILNNYSETDRLVARDLAREGKWRESLAYYARSLISNPGNLVAAQEVFLAVLYGEGPRWRIPIRVEPEPEATAEVGIHYEVDFADDVLQIVDPVTRTNLWPPAYGTEIADPTLAVPSSDGSLIAVSDGIRSEVFRPGAPTSAPLRIAGEVLYFLSGGSQGMALVRLDRSDFSGPEEAVEERSCWRIVNLERGVALELETSPRLVRQVDPQEAPSLATGDESRWLAEQPDVTESPDGKSVVVILGTRCAILDMAAGNLRLHLPEMNLSTEQTDRGDLPSSQVAFSEAGRFTGIQRGTRLDYVDLERGTVIRTFDAKPAAASPRFHHVEEDGSWAVLQAHDGSLELHDLTTGATGSTLRCDEPLLRVDRTSASKFDAVTRAGSLWALDFSRDDGARPIFTEPVGEVRDPVYDRAHGVLEYIVVVDGRNYRTTWDTRAADAAWPCEGIATNRNWMSAVGDEPPEQKPPKSYRRPARFSSGGPVYSRNVVGYERDEVTGEYIMGDVVAWFQHPDSRFGLRVHSDVRRVEIWDVASSNRVGQPIPYALLRNGSNEPPRFVKAVRSGDPSCLAIVHANSEDLILHLPPATPPDGSWLAQLATAAGGLRLRLDGQMDEVSIVECHRLREDIRDAVVPGDAWHPFLAWWMDVASTRGGIRLEAHRVVH